MADIDILTELLARISTKRRHASIKYLAAAKTAEGTKNDAPEVKHCYTEAMYEAEERYSLWVKFEHSLREVISELVG